MANQSHVMFVLIGFPGLPQDYHTLVSVVLFFVYVMAISANGVVIALIIWKTHLHQPMYILIANLAFSDALFDTITLPKLIAKYWFGDAYITFSGCMFQLFCVHFLGSVDSFIIMMMAIDRYVAICRPLRYHTAVTNRRMSIICSVLIIIAAMSSGTNAFWHAQFPYCGSTKVNNCFCVNMAIMGLACGDVTLLKQTIFYISMIVLLLPLSFIIFSYIVIIVTVCLTTGSESRQKAFHTCSIHLFIVGMYYAPRVFVYITYTFNIVLSLDMSVLLLFLYTYIPHMANPIIYCLRNKEIKQTISKVLKIKLKIEDGSLLK
ncbi:olfactory receptor 2AT4-like [Rhinophrynus dorsalis]